MHDINRTTAEFEPESDAFEVDSFGYETSEEFEAYGGTEAESPFSEEEEMDLAAELLGVSNEAELDQFIGGLFKKIGSVARRAIRLPIVRKLGGVLKGVAKRALPMLGTAVGGAFGGPFGAALGGRLASGAGQLFGLELEGLSAEDQEFEVAKQFVRLAGAAANKAASASPVVPPETAARAAMVAAARRYAPGALRGAQVPAWSSTTTPGRSGRWVRRGRKIILLGV